MTDQIVNNSAACMWVIYDHPVEYPEYYVARQWVLGQGPDAGKYGPTDALILDKDLTSLRQKVSSGGRIMIPRDPSDDPVILEVWW